MLPHNMWHFLWTDYHSAALWTLLWTFLWADFFCKIFQYEFDFNFTICYYINTINNTKEKRIKRCQNFRTLSEN